MFQISLIYVFHFRKTGESFIVLLYFVSVKKQWKHLFSHSTLIYALISKQMHNQTFFRAGQIFQIFRAQFVLLIIFLFQMIKPNAIERNTRKLRFPDFLKLFLRREISTKAGNFLSFWENSVVFRTLPNI